MNKDQNPIEEANPTAAEGTAVATCPFCLEGIKLHARRCKHCGSDLNQGNTSSVDANNVVYVFDKGLVRFSKFTLALLGLFVVAGVYLLGIDLKRTVQDIDNLRREIEADGVVIAKQAEQVTSIEQTMLSQQDELQSRHAELEKIFASVGSLRTAIQSDADSAKNALDLILKTQGQVLVVAETLSFAPDGTATVRSSISVVKDWVEERRPYKLWDNGTVLHIRFLGGTAVERQAVEETAREWMKYANIKFVFDDSETAQIRIGFEKGDGSWSYVGTDSVDIDSPESSTMNYGWSILEDRDTILHNFGHVLGLMHEHQNPLNGLDWEEEAVYAVMANAPNFWTRQATFHNIIRKNSPDEYAFPKTFDPNSIMTYPFEPGFLKTPFESGLQPQPGLSAEDIEYIGLLYPTES